MKLKIFLLLLAVSMITACSKEKSSSEGEPQSKVEEFLQQADQHADKPSEFKSYSDSALALARRIGYESGIARALNNLGRYDYSQDNYQAAIDKYSEAEKLFKGKTHKKDLGLLYHRLGVTHEKLSNMDAASRAFTNAINIRKEINDSTGLWYSLNNLGLVYWRTSKFDSAVIYFERVIELSKQMSRKRLYAVSLNNLGSVYYQWSAFDKSIECYLESLRIRKEYEDYTGVSLVLNNIGLVHKDLGHASKAKSYFKDGLKYAQIAEDTNALSYSYNNLGSIYKIENKLDSAISKNQLALAYYRKIDSQSGVLMTLIDLGEIYFIKKNYPKAERAFKRVLEISDNMKVQWRIAEAYFHLGKLNRVIGKLDKAEDYLKTSIEMNKAIKKNNLLQDGYKELYKISNARGNYKTAYAYLKDYERYKDLVKSELLREKITKLENRYELENYRRRLETRQYDNRKQSLIIDYNLLGGTALAIVAVGFFVVSRKRKKINDLLEEKSIKVEEQRKELSRKNDELMELNKSKDRLFSVVAHDLKNPIATLTGFTEILKEDFYELNDDQKLFYITEMEDTIRKTYILLENLLDWSAAQTGRIENKPVKIELREIVDSVFSLLRVQAKNKKITLENNVTSGIKVYADWHMLEVVIRNLLTNALKFSKEGDKVEIVAEKGSGCVTMSIIDQGTGMEEEIRDKLFDLEGKVSNRGTKGEKGTGLGLKISKEFIEKNKGKIWVESELGKGSKFKFTLPV
jgi:signal transduction histidine kinase